MGCSPIVGLADIRNAGIFKPFELRAHVLFSTAHIVDPRISRCDSCSPCAPDQEPARVQRGGLTSQEELTSVEKKEDWEWNQSLQALDLTLSEHRQAKLFGNLRGSVAKKWQQQQWLRMARSGVACCRSVSRHWTGRLTRWIAEIWGHNYYTVALCCRTSHVRKVRLFFHRFDRFDSCSNRTSNFIPNCSKM